MAVGSVIALVHPAMLASPNAEINHAAHLYAGYFAVRNLALAVMLMAALSLGAKTSLNALMMLTALVQILDAGVDCVEARWTVVPGVMILGLLFLLGSARLSGHPFWRLKAWRP
jgi:hypothetical protein